MIANLYRRSSSVSAILAIAAAITLLGCDVPPRPPLDRPERDDSVKRPAASASSTIPLEVPGVNFGEDWETWNVYYLGGQAVGYSYISAKASRGDLSGGSRDVGVQYTFEDQLRFQQGKSAFVQQLLQKSSETSSGELLSLDSTLRVGPTVRRFTGTVSQGVLVMDSVNGTSIKSQKIPWKSTTRGLNAIQQSLRRSPMKNGDKRALDMLVPAPYQVLHVEMQCVGEVAIPLLDGSYTKATEVSCRFIVDEESEQVVQQLVWVDDRGLIVKTLREADSMVSYRVDKETALAAATSEESLVRSTAIALTGKIDRPMDSKQVAFLVKSSAAAKRQDTTIEIPSLPGQLVRQTEDAQQVLVTRNESVPDGFEPPRLIPGDSDLAASKMVDYSAKRVQQIAGTAGNLKDRSETEVAIQLCRVAKDWMQPKPSKGFAPASQIADLAVGGCYEYSVLLTALLRAKKIPARLAAGFVCVPGENPTMAFHIWNLAYVDGRWINLDPMVGTEAPADRIALTTTTLTEGNEYDAFEAIMRAMGKIEFEVRSVQYD